MSLGWGWERGWDGCSHDADDDSVDNLIDTTVLDVSLQFVSVSEFGVGMGEGLGWMQP